jgi:pyruvate formate lyase activating enzyme
MLPIKAIQKLSLIDYPEKLCATLFLGGCNFRCPYCYNVALVVRPETLKSLSEDFILDFLARRTKFLDAICLGGGEPTIHNELLEFLIKVKRLGYLTKLDTNGSRPEILEKLLAEKLIDYIAMDVKAPLGKYRHLAPDVNIKNIARSISILKSSEIDYEFRTTIVPRIIKKEEFIEIVKELKGSKKFVIQQFDNRKTLKKSFQNIKPYGKEKLLEFLEAAKAYLANVELRGI